MTILEYAESLHSTALSDALDACGVEGALSGVMPLWSGARLCGPAYTVRYHPYEVTPDDFRPAGDYIDNVPKGAVLVIDNQGREDCTVWGDILTQVALRNGVAGVVVHGAVRDAASISSEKFPLFCRAVFMRSGKNRVYKAEEQCPITVGGVTVRPGDMIWGDDSGVLSIPQLLWPDIVTKAQAVRATEERIKASLNQGMSLKDARKAYGYHVPWSIVPALDEKHR